MGRILHPLLALSYITQVSAPANEVIEALTIFVKDPAAPPPAEFTVRAVGETLVIRTSNALHREIRRFLNDLLTPQQPWKEI